MPIVRAALVFAEDRFARDQAFAMQGGIILGTGPVESLRERFPDHDVEDWGDVAVLPGTVNGHAHTFQALLRGFGDDLTFARWRDRVLYPFSERLTHDQIRTGAMFDLAEMAKAGVTTAVDFFYLHDGGNEHAMGVIEAARQVGVRLVLARAMYDWTGAPARYRETPERSAANLRELHAELVGDRFAFAQPAPHSIHAASPEMIRAGAALSEELDLPMHIHVAEGWYEREQSMSRHGLSPIAYVDSLGALTERTVVVHAVWVDEGDLALISERGARVVHNPGANAFLGDGVAPFRKMLERNISVCLGTDGGCTNSRQSVFDDMRMAALFAKAIDADASVLRAEDVLIAGTARGGEVLGLPVGRIAADHAADLVVLDLGALSLQPRVTAEKQIVYSMQPDAIARVLVGGEPIVERGELTRVDEAELVSRVNAITDGWSRPA
ncbi:MAG: amidohydrolase family protein [Actinomycetota bacterium]